MVKLEWGAKRTCLGCGARFYDMQKASAACPKCGTVFELQTTTRGRRGKAAAVDVTKDLLALDDVGVDLDLGVDLGGDLGADLIEDTDELGEDLDDIPDVLSDDSDDI